MKPLIIGVAGGTGSGKSTFARKVASALEASSVAFIDMDAYYHNYGHLSIEARRQIPLARFINALGIRYVGETNARVLARHYGSLDAWRERFADFSRARGGLGLPVGHPPQTGTFEHFERQQGAFHPCRRNIDSE